MTQPSSAPGSAFNGSVEGVLELDPQGAGYLRSPLKNFAIRPDDAYVPVDAVRKFALRGGERIRGLVREVNKGNRRFQLARVEEIEGVAVERWSAPTLINDTTAVDPTTQIRFATPGGPREMWVLDLLTPIGFGQRALIVAPPRTGKTILLQQIAHGIATNHPDTYMIVLLIDERPEEVTEMRRNVRGEVVASSNDQDVKSHIRIARLVSERAKRLVEQGKHIIILLDSITRLARAFNSFVGSSGRTMTGGLDIRALEEPKKFFGAARTVENAGSLTIIASALVQTGSRADEFIFQEFKGTGNMELVLDREVANMRIWPAIDVKQSGTRKEEKLLSEEVLKKAHFVRRQLIDMPNGKAMQMLMERMSKHESLEAYLANMRVV
ncbi:MAG: transcription termination factor Rho [Phycisphaerae bacterium]|nr:transcription termination factor Rho [Phycisphaerae bacterium]